MGIQLTGGGALTPEELASLPSGAQVWLIIPLGEPTRYGWSPSLKLETYDRRDGGRFGCRGFWLPASRIPGEWSAFRPEDEDAARAAYQTAVVAWAADQAADLVRVFQAAGLSVVAPNADVAAALVVPKRDEVTDAAVEAARLWVMEGLRSSEVRAGEPTDAEMEAAGAVDKRLLTAGEVNDLCRQAEGLRTRVAELEAERDALRARLRLAMQTEERPKGCQCDQEWGDSDCPMHPTCANCGESTVGRTTGCLACGYPLPAGPEDRP